MNSIPIRVHTLNHNKVNRIQEIFYCLEFVIKHRIHIVRYKYRNPPKNFLIKTRINR